MNPNEHPPTPADRYRMVARGINGFAASPFATAFAFTVVIVWALSGRPLHFSDSWKLAMDTTSSVITFLMVFLIASAQKRDTEALNLKLDLLIARHGELSNTAVGVETANEGQHQQARAELEHLVREAEVESKA